MLKHFVPFAAAAITLGAAPVLAGETVTSRTVRVAVTDLDLAAPPGIHALDRRLAVAIRDACPSPRTPDLRTALDYRTCLAVATRAAEQGRSRALAHAGIARVRLAAVAGR